jgi:hypothetical protein
MLQVSDHKADEMMKIIKTAALRKHTYTTGYPKHYKVLRVRQGIHIEAAPSRH